MKQMGTLGLAMLVVSSASASDPKDATKATISVNNQVKADLPFSDKKDFENAQKGFLPNKTLSRLKMIMVTWFGILKPIKNT